MCTLLSISIPLSKTLFFQSDEVVALATAAKRPAILVDALVARCKAVDAARQLITKSGFPFATPMLGKALLDEDHPQFIGLYSGARSRKYAVPS